MGDHRSIHASELYHENSPIQLGNWQDDWPLDRSGYTHIRTVPPYSSPPWTWLGLIVQNLHSRLDWTLQTRPGLTVVAKFSKTSFSSLVLTVWTLMNIITAQWISLTTCTYAIMYIHTYVHASAGILHYTQCQAWYHWTSLTWKIILTINILQHTYIQYMYKSNY